MRAVRCNSFGPSAELGTIEDSPSAEGALGTVPSGATRERSEFWPRTDPRRGRHPTEPRGHPNFVT